MAARRGARRAGIALREGVYAGAARAPSTRRPAEVRMLRALGAQAVGMSTVHEVIALRHMGVRVAALSCITNLAAGIARPPARPRGGRGDGARAARGLVALLARLDRARRGARVTHERVDRPKDLARLVAAARAARAHAYAPYSHYRVGRGDPDAGRRGSTPGATSRTRRTARRSAPSAPRSRRWSPRATATPVACAVVTAGPRPGAPCGICRQVLAEFARDMPVVLAAQAPSGKIAARTTARLAALLPRAFRLRDP